MVSSVNPLLLLLLPLLLLPLLLLLLLLQQFREHNQPCVRAVTLSKILWKVTRSLHPRF